MRASERTALSKIIDQRFQALALEINEREEDLAEMVRDRILAEAKRATPQATRRVQKFIDRAMKLQAECAAEVKKIESELGVVPGNVRVVVSDEYDMDQYRQAVRARSRPPTKKVTRVEQSSTRVLSLATDNRWSPPRVEKRTAEALRKLGLDAKRAKRRLEAKRLAIQEDLLLGALESQDAKDFLAKVPTVESILPAPTKQKLLEASKR